MRYLTMRWRAGFTLLELLIVAVVFGLFLTLGVLSLNSARARLRDAKRLSDMNVLHATLSQYWFEQYSYPVSTGVWLAQPGTGTEVFTKDGFVSAESAQSPVYVERVPLGPRAGEYYYYTGNTSGYSIRFRTERETDLGPANVYYMHSSGVDQVSEEK